MIGPRQGCILSISSSHYLVMPSLPAAYLLACAEKTTPARRRQDPPLTLLPVAPNLVSGTERPVPTNRGVATTARKRRAEKSETKISLFDQLPPALPADQRSYIHRSAECTLQQSNS